MPTTTPNSTALRLQFFDYIFGSEVGQVCIAVGNTSKSYFSQKWYKWPEERTAMGAFIENQSSKYNVWFGITLFNRPERKRAYAVPGTRVWADLDEVSPFGLDIEPSIIIESSPGRYQGIWSLSDAIPPDIAQDYSRRITYAIGADKSGWDLEQLLRVPYTLNFKYETPAEVKLLRIIESFNTTALFEALPIPSENGNNGEIVSIEQEEDQPDLDTLATLDEVRLIYARELNNPMSGNGNIFRDLIGIEPHESEDWSGRLWRLIMLCFEIGMRRDEVFSVALLAKCNKYTRDNRPISHLWREVKKAEFKHKQFTIGSGITRLEMPQLIDPTKVKEDSFVAEYKSWANDSTDAPEQYHELSCFIGLSAVISNGLALALPYNDNFRPNLWGLLLGESTLSRKTTCMNMTMDLIADLDQSLILASDGSAEGLLSGLAERPKRVSIFYKDEVSGFFDSINRKDYLAGFPETLTKLYDVPKVLPRLLRKETITVVEPYFIFFGGGIRDKVYSLINDNYILSGFLPRFLVVSSENDIQRIRRTGPPTSISTNKKDNLVSRLADLKERYSVQVPMKIGTQTEYIDSQINAYLTPDAWDFFGDVEEQLQKVAYESYWKDIALPTFSRLSFSMLKMSMLVAASRKPATAANKLEVDLEDLHQAAYYVQKWGKHSVELLLSSGKSATEKVVERVLMFIRGHTDGCTQTQIMQRFHMSSKEWREIRETLYDRGLINTEQKGRGMIVKAVKY